MMTTTKRKQTTNGAKDRRQGQRTEAYEAHSTSASRQSTSTQQTTKDRAQEEAKQSGRIKGNYKFLIIRDLIINKFFRDGDR